MTGGLMQLVAYGAQDLYLTGSPQITFWKVVYRRHTNFAMESIEQTFNGQADFGKKVTCTIQRNGDLIYRVYLQATLPAVECPCSESACFRWVNYIGHALIKTVEVTIGGQRIDKQYGDWLNIWNELTQEPGHQVGYDNMVGNTIFLTGTALSHTEATTLYIPFQFWFCRNPGLALPLIALQYHEVQINLEFRNKEECYVAKTSAGCGTGSCGVGNNNCNLGECQLCVGSLEYASLYVDYIYLDTDERRRFAQISHEYLIEQLQFTGDESTTNTNVKVKMNFNHPVKEIIWVVQREDYCCPGINQWNNYTDDFDNDCCEEVNSCPTEPCTICGGISNCIINTNVDNAYGGRTAFPQGPYRNGLPNKNGPISPVCLSCYERCDIDPATGQRRSLPEGPGCDGCGPVNFGSINVGYGGGADHAGLAPLNAGRNPTVRAKIQLNGQDRFSERLGSYFNLVQPWQHHTNVPATGINVYSFALKPEEHQPSGTCNFSRIDNATLQLQLTPKAAKGNGAKIRIYATNYNVLRIMSGMGGVAFAS